MALLSYRVTPLPWCGLSPAQLLMGRQLRTDVPQTKITLTPVWPYLTDFCQKDKEIKKKQKAKRHRVRSVPPLSNDEPVWIHTQDREVPGRVIQPAATLRSYLVETPSGTGCRNQSHFVPRPTESTHEISTDNQQRQTIATRSQTGKYVGPPSRLTYWKKGDVAYS